MKHKLPTHLTSLLTVFIALASLASADRWSYGFEAGWDHQWRASESVFRFDVQTVSKTGMIPVTPGGPVPAASIKIDGSQGASLRFFGDYQLLQTDAFSLSLGGGLNGSNTRVDYHLFRWFLHEAPDGGEFLEALGDRSIRVRHQSLTPEVKLRLNAELGAFSPWVDLRLGYQFMRFQNYHLGTMDASDPGQAQNRPARSANSWEYGIGIGFNYDISGNWALSLGYFFNFLDGYQLSQETEDADFIHEYGYEIRSVKYRRLVFGITRNW